MGGMSVSTPLIIRKRMDCRQVVWMAAVGIVAVRRRDWRACALLTFARMVKRLPLTGLVSVRAVDLALYDWRESRVS